MENLKKFNRNQIRSINNAVTMAEEVVSNAYKMAASQWLRRKYDVRTLIDLIPEEIVHGPFAQVIRYQGQKKDTSLGSSAYDLYKICLQDHSILATLNESKGITLFPFSLYIMTHELIHIVRFSKFLQNFDASDSEIMEEEARVHKKTREILTPVKVRGLSPVFEFYDKWYPSSEKIKKSET
jgi:hypothetical protein